MIKFLNKKIKNTGKKKLYAFLLVLLLFLPLFVHAQNTGSPINAAGSGGAVDSESLDNSSLSNVLSPDSIKTKIILGVSWLFFVLAQFVGKMLAYFILWLGKVALYNDFINVETVRQGWQVVNGFCNMFFILILLYISFAVILRLEGYSIKKMVPKLIIMAILINFSKMICGLIIDFAQVIMLFFVGAFASGTNNLVDLLGITKMWEFVDKADPGTQSDIALETLGAMILAFFAALVAAIVILVMLVTLVMRVVMLWVYVILSPLAYLTAAFPAGRSYSQRWWKEFIDNVMVGPVLGLFLWLALSTAQKSADTLGSFGAEQGASIADENPAIPVTFLQSVNIQRYLITLGLLIGGLIVAKDIGARSGPAISKGYGYALAAPRAIGRKAEKWAKGGAVGTAKFVGRRAGTGTLLAASIATGAGKTRLGKFAGDWRKNLVAKRSEGRARRIKALGEKIGISGGVLPAAKELAESKVGRYAKSAATIAAGTMLGGPLGTAVAAGGVFIGGRTFMARRREEKKEEKGQVIKKLGDFENEQRKILKDNLEPHEERRDIRIKQAEENRDNAIQALSPSLSARDRRLQKNAINATYDTEVEDAENEFKKNTKIYHKLYRQKMEAESEKVSKKQVGGKKIDEIKKQRDDNLTRLTNDRNAELIAVTEPDPIKRRAIMKSIRDKYEKEIDTVNFAFQRNMVAEINRESWVSKKLLLDYHPNKTMMDAIKLGSQEDITAEKRVKSLAEKEKIMNFDASVLYSASGMNSQQKKFMAKLASDTADSKEALNNMVGELGAFVGKTVTKDSDKKRIESLKKAIAAYGKSGKNSTANLQALIDTLDQIDTGNDKQTVESFKESVIEPED